MCLKGIICLVAVHTLQLVMNDVLGLENTGMLPALRCGPCLRMSHSFISICLLYEGECHYVIITGLVEQDSTVQDAISSMIG